MSSYDVILIHPPAIYDFRTRPIFHGPLGASVEQIQFNKVPIGMISIADYLDRHGYRVIVDNLNDRMIHAPAFDVEEHLEKMDASVIAIGLNFQQHSQGAMAIARRCKELHPESTVVMGGLTATRFHEEIILKYPFVDAVIRAEGEKPLLQLVRTLERKGSLAEVPNLTWRRENGVLDSTPLAPASRDLDEFEYTRFDLLEPKTSIYPPQAPPRYNMALCRGCVYNCAICGGSAYSYRTYMGMSRPAFRSPAKIVEDVRKLKEQGICFIGLFQDARMGGKRYWQELFEGLARESEGIERLSLDMLVPADEEFIKAAANIGPQVVMHLCPDTGSEKVRRRLGRPYGNEELMECIRLCHKHHLPVTTFFSAGLAGENPENVSETWNLWEALTALDGQSLRAGDLKVPHGGPITGPIVLDPGSLAFDEPERYGYLLRYKDLEEYIGGLSQPSWHQWLNYTTEELDNAALVDLVLTTVDFSINQREKSGLYSWYQAAAERLKTEADRVIVEEIERIMTLEEPLARKSAIRDLKDRHQNFLNSDLRQYIR
jgi:B12-binding domain/radical SAM domain protein